MTRPIRRTVGFFTTEACSPYFSPLIESLSAVCEERDSNLIVFTDAYLDPDAGGEAAARVFAAKLAGPTNVDALIVPALGNAASQGAMSAFLERFRAIPIYTLSLGLAGYPDVQVDNDIGFREVVRHLVEVHRYQRFVLLARPAEHAEGRVRAKAYREQLASYGIEPLPDIVVPGDPTLDPGIIIQALADIGCVDAIVAVDDYLVPALMQALAVLKRRVPEDVAVTGCDDSDIANSSDPPLTSIRQPFIGMLEAAVDSLFRRLDGQDVPAQTLVPPELVVRRSCGCNAERMSIYAPDGGAGRATLSARLAEARASVVEAWMNVPGLRLPRGVWEEALYTRCAAQLTDEQDAQRATVARWARQHVANGGDVGAWKPVLSILKRTVMPLVGDDSAARARAEALILGLRVQIGDVEASQARGLRHRSDVLARQQAVVALQLLRNLDRERLIAALPGLFSRLKVQTFWFSTYPDEQDPGAGARLASAMVKGQPAVDRESEVFLPQLLVPERHRPTERYTWIVSPVHDDERQLGLLVCEYMSNPGATFDIMALQLGAALHGAWLVRRVAEETERRQRADRERLERELELARRIQTSILPRNLAVPGLDVATVMVTATEVGGDYFDVIPVDDGCFLGIGDVVGHGLDAGLVMMMLQSAVATAVAVDSSISPRQAYAAANRVLHENIRNRLEQEQHITLSILRYHTNGRLVFTGEHEDMLLFRAKTGQVDVVRVEGIWAGIVPDVSELIDDREVWLEPGDVLLLYTDGVVQAMNTEREMFGLERLSEELCSLGRQPSAAIRAGLLAAVQRWMDVQSDDLALVVARYAGTDP